MYSVLVGSWQEGTVIDELCGEHADMGGEVEIGRAFFLTFLGPAHALFKLLDERTAIAAGIGARLGDGALELRAHLGDLLLAGLLWPIERGQIGSDSASVGVLGPQHLFVNRKRAFEVGSRCAVVARRTKQCAQVVQAQRRVGVLGPQHLFADGKRAFVVGSRCAVVARR